MGELIIGRGFCERKMRERELKECIGRIRSQLVKGGSRAVLSFVPISS